MTTSIKQNPISFIALFIALPALCLAVIPPLVIKPEPKKLTSVLLEEGASLALKLLKKDPAAPPPKDNRETTLYVLHVASIALGLLAVSLGLFAWIRKEHRRVCLSAMGVGAIAALWVYLIVAVMTAVILFILLGLISEEVV